MLRTGTAICGRFWGEESATGTGATGIARLAVENASANLITHQLDNTMPPTPSTQITAGSTWHFSCYYRDPAAGGACFSLSDALSITFIP